MEWLTRGWDQGHVVSAAVGVVAGVSLVVWGRAGLAEVAGVLVGVCSRWALWQIPPPGRSTAPGTPRPGWLSRLGQVAVAVLGVVLVAEVARGLAT